MNATVSAVARVARRFWYRLLGLDSLLCPRCGKRARRLGSHLEFASGEADDPYRPLIVQRASLQCSYCEARWGRKECEVPIDLTERRT